MKCVSKSSGVGKLFYKFKVVAGLSEQLAYIDDEVRRYDVSGIELQTVGEATATEYPISTTFYYSGYSKGFGKDKESESTLSCRSESLETVRLEVKHTTYKYQNAKNGGQEIASVYFKVPKKYFDTYDGLQRIKAEWLKAVTKDILVTNDKIFYSYLKKWVGKDVGEGTTDMRYYIYDTDSYATGEYIPVPGSNTVRSQTCIPWVYNVMFTGNFYFNVCDERMTTLYWLFHGDGNLKDISISSNTVLNYYNNSPYKDSLLSSVDKEKTVAEIDADDAFRIEGFDKNSSLVNWLTKLLYPDIQTSDLNDISPIKVLTKDDVKGLDTEVAERLYVDKYDVSDIKESVNDTDSKTVLFRFAVGEYLNKELSVYDIEENIFNHDLGTELVYRNRLPMYLDFDIIWLGFQKGDKLTIIPAVSSPITVVGGTQPPVKDLGEKAKDALEDFWKKIQDAKDGLLKVLKWVGIALGAVLVVFLLYVVINAIVKACTAVSNKRTKKSTNNRYTKK